MSRRRGRRVRDLELELELRERVLVTELCTDVDEDQAERGSHRYGDKNTEQAVQGAAGEQREDHDSWVEPHDPTDDERDDEVVLGVTQHGVHRGDDRDVPNLR